jgi:hypothetical protein
LGEWGVVSENKEKLKYAVLGTESQLMVYIGILAEKSYENIITSYNSLEEYDQLLLTFNETVAEHNSEA